MHRRICAIPLCIIFCIAVFSSSVLAIPPNDFSTTINCSFELNSGLANYSFNLQSGNLNSWGIWSSNSDNYVSLSSYSGVMPYNYDLYIAVLTSSLPHVYFEGLEQYYYPAGNIVESVNLTTALDVYSGGSSFTPNSPLATQSIESVTFCYFRDVPANTAFQVNDINPYPAQGNSFVNAYCSVAGANVNFTHFLFGFYFASAKLTGDQIVDQFKNGEISFDDAIAGLKSLRDDSIDSSSDFTQSILNFSIVQSQIEEIISFSDFSFSQIAFGVYAELQPYFAGIRTGTTDISFILDLLPTLSEQLYYNAHTADQMSLAFTLYQSFFDQFKFEYSIFQDSQLTDSVPDEYVDLSDEYMAAEDEIFALFDRAEFEAQIAYETWLYSLPTNEANQFKRFFDYLFIDSPLKFFITVPMCLGIVSIVLGTRLTPFRSDSPLSDEDRYWKSVADNYFNFKGG